MAMLQSSHGRNKQRYAITGQRWQISIVHLSQFEVRTPRLI